MGKLFFCVAIPLMGLSIVMLSCTNEEDAVLIGKSVKATGAEVLGKKIDIILLDENRILLNGKQVETGECAGEIANKLGIRDGERLQNYRVTAVISAGDNIEMGQVQDVQSVLRDLDVRKVKYLGRNCISPVLVF